MTDADDAIPFGLDEASRWDRLEGRLGDTAPPPFAGVTRLAVARDIVTTGTSAHLNLVIAAGGHQALRVAALMVEDEEYLPFVDRVTVAALLHKLADGQETLVKAGEPR